MAVCRRDQAESRGQGLRKKAIEDTVGWPNILEGTERSMVRDGTYDEKQVCGCAMAAAINSF